MIAISPPVASTLPTGSKASWMRGKEKTPTRAPQAKLESRVTRAQAPRAIAPATGDSVNPPPTKVITAFPPRKEAKTGKACPSIAPATAA